MFHESANVHDNGVGQNQVGYSENEKLKDKKMINESNPVLPPSVIPGIPVVHLNNSPYSKRSLELGRASPLPNGTS